MDAKKDTLPVIDKRNLEIVRTVTPGPNKIVAHVEFDSDGRHALVSICENDGAGDYHAVTSAEVKRQTEADLSCINSGCSGTGQ